MRAEQFYRTLLYCYPPEFRQEYGGEMTHLFRDQLDEARRSGGAAGQAIVWIRGIADLFTVAPKEHYHMILQDIRFALRTFAKTPSYPAVAILSLALGIGANTAIFSLMNGVLLSQLPVRDPGQLVLLSDPRASGVSIGSQGGVRSLLTYAEFEQLRAQAQGFAGMMASESSLGRVPVRIEGGEPEEAQSRMVSRDYFQVLGVHPAMGRTLDPAPEPVAVISHSYWRRRFGGKEDAIGKRIQIRRATLTIAGVAPADFFGETAGQSPDIWTPLDLQPQILPGRDWLHDKGTEKVMWLQVFGRLHPGVPAQQAEASANAVFKHGLEQQYGEGLTAEARKDFQNQTLKLSPAASGASSTRKEFAEPIRVLFVVVVVVLLIACANLANLLLARGATRRREIALRLSLGAGRMRLIRQLLTESVILAIAGGAASIAVAYAVHRMLVQMFAQASDGFGMSFQLDPRIFTFTLGLSLVTAVLFGLLPALHITSTDVALHPRELGRGGAGSAGRMRWGRLLVGAQIALSLPLLLGAGLLLRSLNNLQSVDLGYSRDNLLLLRVDAETAGYEPARRVDRMLELLGNIRKVPGVSTASFSENGLFSGSNSGDQVIVEGYTPKGTNDQGSSWDQAGPGYFSTLGVPLLQGRDFQEGDRAGSRQVCIINEAFSKLFFSGRNPMGMHITAVYGDRRVTHEIVGVARDHRTHRLQGVTPPRYFVPLTQPLGEAGKIVFEIRTSGPAAALMNPLRRIVSSYDPNLPVTSFQTIDENLSKRLARDRVTSRLTAALGIAALLLAAAGLFGVLSYGIATRRNEIGVRMALGANPTGVVAMILRETGVLVAAGLLVGVALAAGTGRLLASQIYGVTPTDPATFAAAIGILALVALAAAFLPALRASRVDPMVTLRQE
jgi:predicted permease